MFYSFSRGLLIPVDLPLGSREHPGVYRHIHGQRTSQDRQPFSSVVSNSGPLRRLFGDDFRRSKRSIRLLDLRGPILRHLDSFRRYVLDSEHIEFVRHIAGSIYPHKGSPQVSRSGVFYSSLRIR